MQLKKKKVAKWRFSDLPRHRVHVTYRFFYFNCLHGAAVFLLRNALPSNSAFGEERCLSSQNTTACETTLTVDKLKTVFG